MKFLLSRRTALASAASLVGAKAINASPSGSFSPAAKKKLVLTGDMGKVGARLIALGIFEAYDLVLIDRKRGPEENMSIPNGEWVSKFKGAAACVHLAWEMRDPLVYEVAAIQATVNVMEACCFHNVPNFVFSSSAWADPLKYGAKISAAARVSYYGAAKRFIEDSMRLFSAETGFCMAAIRLGRVAPDINIVPDNDFGSKIWMSDEKLKSSFGEALSMLPTSNEENFRLIEPMTIK